MLTLISKLVMNHLPYFFRYNNFCATTLVPKNNLAIRQIFTMTKNTLGKNNALIEF